MKLLLTLMICMALPVYAQDHESEETPVAAGCSSDKYREFDFWIGEWSVSSNGEAAGTNNIQTIHNGCVLQETWQGAGVDGISGSSFNIYNRANDKWHQTWVDNSGTLLEFDGGMRDGSMVLQGSRLTANGSDITTHRISWTPNEDGSVRQLWDVSRDGEVWTVLFDGLYTRITAN